MRRSATRSSDYFFTRFRGRPSPSDEEELTAAEAFLFSCPFCKLLVGKYLHIYIPTSLSQIWKTVFFNKFFLASLNTPLRTLCLDPLLAAFEINFGEMNKLDH